MKNLTLEYVAGFFDGEGCICISRSPQKNRTYGEHWHYGLTVRVSSTYKLILDLLLCRFGGSMHPYPAKPGGKPAWGWAFVSGGIARQISGEAIDNKHSSATKENIVAGFVTATAAKTGNSTVTVRKDAG